MRKTKRKPKKTLPQFIVATRCPCDRKEFIGFNTKKDAMGYIKIAEALGFECLFGTKERAKKKSIRQKGK